MSRHDEGFFSSKDNLRLFWQSDFPEAPKAHVAVIHGYADHSGRFRGVIDALVADGFAVHAFDYRGHGKADGRRGYCDRFSQYLDDLGLFWSRVRAAAGTQKSFIYGHSHGALMTVLWQATRPEGLDGIILTSPYLKLALKPPGMKVFGAKLVGNIIPWLPIKNELTVVDLSRDEAWQKSTAADPLYNTTVTPRWFTESIQAQAEAVKLGPTFQKPLFMGIGEKDGVASTTTNRAFFETVASVDKRLKEYPGMRHEPVNEIGKEEVWRDISGWISAHL